jgi:hypothetical protein
MVDENIAKQTNVMIKRRINIERVSTQPVNSRIDSKQDYHWCVSLMSTYPCNH